MPDLSKLFTDVFDPQPGETALVLIDTPHGTLADTPAWQQRRAMAERWHAALCALGQRRSFEVLPLTSFPATGAHNAPLPATGHQAERQVQLADLAERATILLAVTQFSASGPLLGWTQRAPRLRVASLPAVAPELEHGALAADHARIARACARLRARLDGADYARIGFSNGDRLVLDLRFRAARADGGNLHADSPPPRLVHLPGGKSYTALYEGERPGTPSATRGVLPVSWRGELVRLEIDLNRVIDVLGRSEAADDLHTFLSVDAARRNVAELGLGCNPAARVSGHALEDERAGPHIALGASEHIGGVVGPGAFDDPRYAWHQDFVYAPDSPVHIAKMHLIDAQGREEPLVINGRYVEELEI